MKFKYMQIASEAGVSLATVSRAMRGVRGPSEKTRKKVIEAAQSIGYFPVAFHPKAEVILRFAKEDQMPTDPFYGLVYNALMARAKVLHLRVGLVRAPNDSNLYGIISVGHLDQDTLDTLARTKVPTILVDDDDPRFDRVVFQDEYGGMLAAQHLLERVPSHKGIAIVSGTPQHHSFALRTRGAVRALEQAQRFDERWVFEPHLTTGYAGLSMAEGRVAAEWLLPRLDRIGGVFVGNDLAASALVDQLTRAGIRIPRDLLVVGHDDQSVATQSVVPLTTVKVDAQAMGWWAVNLLLHRLMEPKHPPVQVVVGVELVVRESTRLED